MDWKTCILHLLVLISLYIHVPVLHNINLVLFIVQEFTHVLYFKKYLSYTLHQILILKYSKCIYLK